MASISFDRSTGWWSVRYVPGEGQRRVKRTLCKHPYPWSRTKPPKKAPPEVQKLAEPFEAEERAGRLGQHRTGLAPIPLKAHLRAYVGTYAASHAVNSTRVLETALGHFLSFCERRQIKTLQALTPGLCSAFLDERRSSGVKASTLRTERAYLATIWAKASRRREIAENPWEFPTSRGQGPRIFRNTGLRMNWSGSLAVWTGGSRIGSSSMRTRAFGSQPCWRFGGLM